MKPITPAEAAKKKVSNIPEVVIESVNELIAENYSEGEITVKQDEIIARILSKDCNTTRDEIYKKKWLDFEPLFREHGWKVEYEKPAYYESWDAYFSFKAKK